MLAECEHKKESLIQRKNSSPNFQPKINVEWIYPRRFQVNKFEPVKHSRFLAKLEAELSPRKGSLLS